MERRSFLKALGVGAAAAAAPVAAIAVMRPEREKRKPLPEMQAGQLLTADSWNNVVRDVNQVHESIRVNRIYVNELWALNGTHTAVELRP